MRDRTRSNISRAVLPASVVLAWLAVAVAQRFDAPALGAEFMSLILGIPLIFWAWWSGRLNRRRVLLIIATLVPVVLMFLAAVRAVSPVEALLGDGPLWQGWLLWGVALGWFVTALLVVDGKDLKLIVQALSGLGTLTGVWALAEYVRMVPTYQVREGMPSMAIFDSPNSMGQALVLTIAATLSLALERRLRRSVRLGYWAMALVQFAALAAGGARAALLGVVVGAAAFGLLVYGKGGVWRATRAASMVVLVVFSLTVGVVAAAWSGVLGPAAFTRADNVLTGRFAIWDDVSQHLKGHALLGTGPVPFDAIIKWDVTADGGVAAEVTYDEHSMLLTWLMSTGLVGFIVFGVAAILVGVHIVRSAYAAKSSASVRALAAAGVAVFVSMLSSWPDPLALIGICLVVGGLVSNGALGGSADHDVPSPRSVWVSLPFAGAALVTLVALIALVPAVVARLETSHASDYPDMVSHIEGALRSTRDYSYLTHELTLIERKGNVAVSDEQAIDVLRRLAEAYPEGAQVRVEIPLVALDILFHRSQYLSSQEYWKLSEFYARQGMRCDPGSAVWSYGLARAAYLAGRPDRDDYVSDALAQDLPDSAALYLRHIR